MESQNLDMNDLFDTDAGVDHDVDDVGAAPMSGFDDETEEGPMYEDHGEEHVLSDGEGGDVLAKLRALKQGAAKKRVLKPQPKLDADRLKSNLGLPLLPKIFEKLRFQGKGFEGEDLTFMMTFLEHWGHRLCPNMTFDTLIARLEKLGQKKEVQTCLKRIRLDMPIQDVEMSTMYDSDENNEQPPAADNDAADAFDAEDAYDEMIRDERAAMQNKRRREEQGDEQTEWVMSKAITPAKRFNSQEQHEHRETTPAPNLTSLPTANGMTLEQMTRIQQNKMKALEKRAAKLGIPISSLMPQVQQESSQNTSGHTTDTQNTEHNSSAPLNDEPTTSNAIPNSKFAREHNDSSDSPIRPNKKAKHSHTYNKDTNRAENGSGETTTINQTEDELLNEMEIDEENVEVSTKTFSENAQLENGDSASIEENVHAQNSLAKSTNVMNVDKGNIVDAVEGEDQLKLVLSECQDTENTCSDSEGVGRLELSNTANDNTENDTVRSEDNVGQLRLPNTCTVENTDISTEKERCLQLPDATNTTQEEENTSDQ